MGAYSHSGNHKHFGWTAFTVIKIVAAVSGCALVNISYRPSHVIPKRRSQWHIVAAIAGLCMSMHGRGRGTRGHRMLAVDAAVSIVDRAHLVIL